MTLGTKLACLRSNIFYLGSERGKGYSCSYAFTGNNRGGEYLHFTAKCSENDKGVGAKGVCSHICSGRKDGAGSRSHYDGPGLSNLIFTGPLM